MSQISFGRRSNDTNEVAAVGIAQRVRASSRDAALSGENEQMDRANSQTVLRAYGILTEQLLDVLPSQTENLLRRDKIGMMVSLTEQKIARENDGRLRRTTTEPQYFENGSQEAQQEAPNLGDQGHLLDRITTIIATLILESAISLTKAEQHQVITLLLCDILGFGPIEPLLRDDDITDIMINGARSIYIERRGKLELTDVHFRDNQHVLRVGKRMVVAVGRRVDEESPLCDARLADGSRINVIIPPLAIDGTSISIRRFGRRQILLDAMVAQGNLDAKMSQLLQIIGRCRLNVLISGGTGSGKTTLLNAISRNIDPAERIVTIEDVAELRLQQPHVVRLETRQPNLDGSGGITIRDLVRNALRMRPDRIIVGEVRGAEAFDLLQAMSTGHDGSLGTVHANRPREAVTRLENMINIADLNLPASAIRSQIAAAINVVIQISRMRDGLRRVTHISEITGMEGDVVLMQDLYTYQQTGEDEGGHLRGTFISAGLRPNFYERAVHFGFGRALMECF